MKKDDYQLLSQFVSVLHMSMRAFFTKRKQVDKAVASMRKLLCELGRPQSGVSRWIDNSLEVQHVYHSLF